MPLGGPGFAAIAAALAGHAAAGDAKQPGSKASNGDERFAMAGDDGFALAASDGVQDLADGFGCGYDDPARDGFGCMVVKSALVVDPADVARHKAGADQGDRNARESEFRRDGIGERADREFAHGVGGGARSRSPASDTPD